VVAVAAPSQSLGAARWLALDARCSAFAGGVPLSLVVVAVAAFCNSLAGRVLAAGSVVDLDDTAVRAGHLGVRLGALPSLGGLSMAHPPLQLRRAGGLVRAGRRWSASSCVPSSRWRLWSRGLVRPAIACIFIYGCQTGAKAGTQTITYYSAQHHRQQGTRKQEEFEGEVSDEHTQGVGTNSER